MSKRDPNRSSECKDNGTGEAAWHSASSDLYRKFHDMDLRLVRIEERLEHLPTKAWIARGVVTGIAIGTTLALAILKIFDS